MKWVCFLRVKKPRPPSPLLSLILSSHSSGPSASFPLSLQFPPRSLLSFPGGKWVQFGMVQKGKWGRGEGGGMVGGESEVNVLLLLSLPCPLFLAGWLRSANFSYRSPLILSILKYTRNLCKFLLQHFSSVIFPYLPCTRYVYYTLHDNETVLLFLYLTRFFRILKLFNRETSNTRTYFVKYRLQNENAHQLKCHRVNHTYPSMSLQGKETTLKSELAESTVYFPFNKII